MQIFNANTILFSSKRAGGYGGYDIYATYLKDGEWTAPQNLGPEVNSRYNECAPFLAKSGKKLYYSSDHINGFGGYDIFEMEYNITSSKWEEPANIGVPINSAMDDLNFSLSSDGMTATFSSERMDSYGGSDLYLAYYKDQVMDQLMYTENLPFLQYDMDSSEASEISEISEEPTTQITDEVAEEKIIKKEFFNQPLYYGGDEIILTPVNRSKLGRIKDILVVYPEVSVVLNGHSIKEGMREFDLYFSIKRAEKAALFLTNQGIDPKRIKVRGLGSNYPHTAQNGGRLADKNNRRIDVSFIKVPTNRLKVITDMPAVSDALKDGSSDQYYNTLKGLAYKIEVAKTKQMFKGDIIRQYENGAVEKQITDSDYTYTIGVFDEYQTAKQLKGTLLRKGVIDAKIIPYMNDVKLAESEVEVLKDVYPDLRRVLEI